MGHVPANGKRFCPNPKLTPNSGLRILAALDRFLLEKIPMCHYKGWELNPLSKQLSQATDGIADSRQLQQVCSRIKLAELVKSRFARLNDHFGRFKGAGEISRTRRKLFKQLEIFNASPLETLHPKRVKIRSQNTFYETVKLYLNDMQGG